MNNKEKQVVFEVLMELAALSIRSSPMDKVYYERIKNKLNDLRFGRYTFRKQLKLLIRKIKNER